MTTAEALVFIGAFSALFLLRLAVATVLFLWILPKGDNCPICDAHTLHLRRPVWNWLFPRLRTSWCIDCGWEGLLRHGPPRDEPLYAVRRGVSGRASRKP